MATMVMIVCGKFCCFNNVIWWGAMMSDDMVVYLGATKLLENNNYVTSSLIVVVVTKYNMAASIWRLKALNFFFNIFKHIFFKCGPYLKFYTWIPMYFYLQNTNPLGEFSYHNTYFFQTSVTKKYFSSNFSKNSTDPYQIWYPHCLLPQCGCNAI